MMINNNERVKEQQKLEPVSMWAYANEDTSPFFLMFLKSKDEEFALLNDLELEDEFEFDDYMDWLFCNGYFKLSLDPTLPIEDWNENVYIEFLPSPARQYQFKSTRQTT